MKIRAVLAGLIQAISLWILICAVFSGNLLITVYFGLIAIVLYLLANKIFRNWCDRTYKVESELE